MTKQKCPYTYIVSPYDNPLLSAHRLRGLNGIGPTCPLAVPLVNTAEPALPQQLPDLHPVLSGGQGVGRQLPRALAGGGADATDVNSRKGPGGPARLQLAVLGPLRG